MKFLANENFPFESVLVLRKAGYDVLSIGSDYSGIADEEIVSLANKEQRTILPFDKDYGELIFKHGYKSNNGVIFLRIHHFKPSELAEMLMALFKNRSFIFNKQFTVIDKNFIRQKKIS